MIQQRGWVGGRTRIPSICDSLLNVSGTIGKQTCNFSPTCPGRRLLLLLEKATPNRFERKKSPNSGDRSAPNLPEEASLLRHTMPSNILTLGCALALRAAGAAAQDSELLPVGAMDGSWDGTSTYACNFEFGSRTEKQCQKEDLPPAGDRVTLQECEADCAPVPPPPPLQYNFSCYKFIATYACFKTGFQSGCQVVDPGTNKSTLGEEFATYAECTSAANDCKPDGAKPASEGGIQCKNLYGLSEDDKKRTMPRVGRSQPGLTSAALFVAQTTAWKAPVISVWTIARHSSL